MLVYCNGGRLLVPSLTAIICALSGIFSYERLPLIKQAAHKASGKVKANSLIWLATVVATVVAIFGRQVVFTELPDTMFKVAAGGYMLAALVISLFHESKSEQPVQNRWQWPTLLIVNVLSRREKLRDVWVANTVLTLLFSAWFWILATLAIEGCEPGGVDICPAFACLLSGLGAGCLLAQWSRRQFGKDILFYCVIAYAIPCLTCALAFSSPVLRLSLAFAGCLAGVALVSVDTTLQSVMPSRSVAVLGGLRDAVCMAVIVAGTMLIEQNVELSALSIFRALAVAHLALIALCVLIFVRSRRNKEIADDQFAR